MQNIRGSAPPKLRAKKNSNILLVELRVQIWIQGPYTRTQDLSMRRWSGANVASLSRWIHLVLIWECACSIFRNQDLSLGPILSPEVKPMKSYFGVRVYGPHSVMETDSRCYIASFEISSKLCNKTPRMHKGFVQLITITINLWVIGKKASSCESLNWS